MQDPNVCLLNKNCIPCQGGIPPLSSEIVYKLLSELGNGWIISESNKLYKDYNFMEAMSFANKIAEFAEL